MKNRRIVGKIPVYIGFVLIIITLVQCKQHVVPKPKGYFRIDFPKKEYVQYKGQCPFSFEYPKYGKIVKDSAAGAEPCWFNIEFPHFKTKIHLSYKKVQHNVDTYIEDAHTLAYKHTIKADAIKEKYFENPSENVYGLLYDIKGNAASSVQFFVTDSIHNFLRGALYFSAEPNKDSLAPAIDFFKKDILHLIGTFKWEK